MCVFITWHLWICDCWHKAKLPIAPPLRLCLHVCMCFQLVGNQSFPPLHPPTEERRAHTDYRCLNDTTVPRQSKRLLWNELLRQLDICRPSIQSILFFLFFPFKPNLFFCFLLLFWGNKKKNNKTHFSSASSQKPSSTCTGEITLVTNLYKASESSHRLSRRRRDGTDTVRDTSCACQSGNFLFTRKVQIRSTLPVALVAFLLYGL